MKNDKWKELRTLRNLRSGLELDGAGALVLTELDKKISSVCDSIRREALMQDDERADVAQKNRRALVELMLQYDIIIPAREFANWRPTKRSKGCVPGVWDYVEIVATDGLQAYYLNGDECVIGHIQKFDGKVEPLFSVEPKPQERKPTVRKPRTPRVPMTSASALDLIAQITGGNGA